MFKEVITFRLLQVQLRRRAAARLRNGRLQVSAALSGHRPMGFVQALRDRLFRRPEQRRPDPAIYHELRWRLLTVPVSELKLSPSPEHPVVWAGFMDWHVGSGVATLVAIADGTVSLYLSHGGGVIGAGTHEEVLRVARRFLATLEAHRASLAPVDSPPLPGPGRVRFIARTFDATVATPELVTETVGSGGHPLSPLFDVAQELITAIRQASP